MMNITRIFVINSRATASGERIDEILNTPEDFIDGDLEIVKNVQSVLILLLSMLTFLMVKKVINYKIFLSH
jgi:hypothetical protein